MGALHVLLKHIERHASHAKGTFPSSKGAKGKAVVLQSSVRLCGAVNKGALVPTKIKIDNVSVVAFNILLPTVSDFEVGGVLR